jgi:hypothetical protein
MPGPSKTLTKRKYDRSIISVRCLFTGKYLVVFPPVFHTSCNVQTPENFFSRNLFRLRLLVFCMSAEIRLRQSV